ncbi:MAG TPA: lipoprotein [Beijerinckiaceae bacterium]
MKQAKIALALGLAVATTLAGCGRRGALEAPPGAPAAAAEKPASRVGVAPPKPNPAPVAASRANAPDRPFILDPLL